MLLVCKENFLRLPFTRAIFVDDYFHERDQFALRAYAADFGLFRFADNFDAMTVTNIFHFIGTEFNSGPIAQGFGGGDEVLIPVACGEGFLQFSQRHCIAQ